MKRWLTILGVGFLLFGKLASAQDARTEFRIKWGDEENNLSAPIYGDESSLLPFYWIKDQDKLFVRDPKQHCWKVWKDKALHASDTYSWLDIYGKIVFDSRETKIFNAWLGDYCIAFRDKTYKRINAISILFDYNYSMPKFYYYFNGIMLFTDLGGWKNGYVGVRLDKDLENGFDVIGPDAVNDALLKVGAIKYKNWVVVDGIPLVRGFEDLMEYWLSYGKIDPHAYDSVRYYYKNSVRILYDYGAVGIDSRARMISFGPGPNPVGYYTYKGYFIGNALPSGNWARSDFQDGGRMIADVNDATKEYIFVYLPNQYALWVNDDKVRIRDKPTTDGKILTQVDKGTVVYYRGESKNKMTIGSMTAEWKKVMTEDGLEGWIFGGFVQWNPLD